MLSNQQIMKSAPFHLIKLLILNFIILNVFVYLEYRVLNRLYHVNYEMSRSGKME